MKKLGLFLYLSSALILSCSKDDDPQPSRSELLLNNVWQLEGFRYGNVFEEAEFCFRGNTLTFLEDGTYKNEDAAPICPSDEYYEGTWSLSDDEKNITMSIDYGSGDVDVIFSIVKLTSSEFEIQEASQEVLVYTVVD